MTTSPKLTPVPEPPAANVVAYTTAHAICALLDAIEDNAAKASPPVLNSARAAVATLQSSMSGCGLLSIPSASARGCNCADAFLVIATTARSLVKPNKMSENARTTLGCAFSTALIAMKNIGALT